jgi:GrpB-like predicted nucleotidyltransferase (UPF0157 family)
VWEESAFLPALMVVNHFQAARIARRLMDYARSRSGRPGVAAADPAGPATFDAAFVRLRERLELKRVAITHVKDVALESLVRAKAQIDVERDPL